ncbi:thermonuclease family protein [Streptomyces scabiei]|uniref:thermonuclease family protein n=1 Tax=Streptomyces scabiei TaxID=1930 RepID=UPI001B32DCF8|nr:thermonuclease family protein [Streptomyces sp. LBUM 1481]
MYLYVCRAVTVVDGDTLDVDVDLGFGVWTRQRIRLLGVNAPEHGTPDGDAATAFTADWLRQHAAELTLRTTKKEKYGRYLGAVLSGARSLNDDLVTAGHAVPYDGGRRTIGVPVVLAEK